MDAPGSRLQHAYGKRRLRDFLIHIALASVTALSICYGAFTYWEDPTNIGLAQTRSFIRPSNSRINTPIPQSRVFRRGKHRRCPGRSIYGHGATLKCRTGPHTPRSAIGNDEKEVEVGGTRSHPSLVDKQYERIQAAMKPSTEVQFFTDRMCTYAQTTWILLLEKRIKYQLIEIEDLEDKPPWYLQYVNPTGCVPTVVLADSKNVLWDSKDIASLLLSRYRNRAESLIPEVEEDGEESMAPQKSWEERKADLLDQWYEFVEGNLAGSFAVFVDALSKKDETEIFHAGQALLETLQKLDDRIRGPWILGDQFSIADALVWPIMCRIDFVLREYTDFEVPEDLQQLQAWLARSTSRQSFEATRPSEELLLRQYDQRLVPAALATTRQTTSATAAGGTSVLLESRKGRAAPQPLEESGEGERVNTQQQQQLQQQLQPQLLSQLLPVIQQLQFRELLVNAGAKVLPAMRKQWEVIFAAAKQQGGELVQAAISSSWPPSSVLSRTSPSSSSSSSSSSSLSSSSSSSSSSTSSTPPSSLYSPPSSSASPSTTTAAATASKITTSPNASSSSSSSLSSSSSPNKSSTSSSSPPPPPDGGENDEDTNEKEDSSEAGVDLKQTEKTEVSSQTRPTVPSSSSSSSSSSDGVATADQFSKFVWSASEIVGKAAAGFLGKESASSSSSYSSARSPEVLPREQALAMLREDCESGYFLTGKATANLYDEDCEFADPFASFRGYKRFAENLANLQPFIKDSYVKLIDFKEEEGEEAESSSGRSSFSVNTRYMVRLTLGLPWTPTLAWIWGVRFEFSEETGRVARHVESWNVSPQEGITQLFRPGSKNRSK